MLGFSMPKYARKAASGRFYVFCTNLTQPTGALDSKTGRVIMDIFHKLHEEQGKTIVLITHSNELANETERIITLRDGEITGIRKGELVC